MSLIYCEDILYWLNIISNLYQLIIHIYRKIHIKISLYYCSSRYYDPKLRRWISIDDISYLNSKSVNRLNLYCYCFNNPIMYKGSSGHLYSARSFIRGREDDIAKTLKLSKNISRVANVIGGALFVMDVATTWYTNYNSGSDTWVTDSLTDTLIDGIIFAVGFIPGWGWIASLGLAGIKYLIEKILLG